MFVRTKNRRRLRDLFYVSRQCRFLFFCVISLTAFESHSAEVKPKTNKPNLLGIELPTPSPSPKKAVRVIPAETLYEKTPETFPTGTNNPYLPRDKFSPIDATTYQPPRGETDWKDFFSNIHGSYQLSFMGPRVAGSGNETYNIYLPDVAPVQISHYWNLGFQVNPNVQIGFKASAIQNVADNIRGKTGIIRGRTYEGYDPEIYANFPNLIHVTGFNVFSAVSMSVPLTEVSQRNGKITKVDLDQSWTLANSELNNPWTFGVNARFEPVFFSDPMPTNVSFRKTFYFSTGHLISYRVSPTVNIQSTSSLDFDHRYSTNTPNLSEFNSGLDDTSRLSIYFSPMISQSWFISAGGYLQFLLWGPSAETSILGLDFTIGF